MDMEESGEESNAAGEQYEEEVIPKVITDEVFDEVTTRANTIIRDLQVSKQYITAEDVQKLVFVCQNLRQNVIDERDKIEQMKTEVLASQSRVQHAVKISMQDQEAIQQLKREIGNFSEIICQNHLKSKEFFYDFLLLLQIKHGVMRMPHKLVSKSPKRE